VTAFGCEGKASIAQNIKVQDVSNFILFFECNTDVKLDLVGFNKH
jgi:hypothetical protein